MFKSLLREVFAVIRSRIFILGAVFFAMFMILFHRLFVLQIVEGSDYLETFTYRIQKETQTNAPRGTIYDKNGTILAYDRLAYSVIIEDSPLLIDNDTRNAMIEKLIAIVEANGRETINNMPFILNDDGTVEFTGSDRRIRNFKKDIFGLNYTDSLSEKREAMNGQELFDYMRSKDLFNLDPEIDPEDALKILALRYELYMKRYQKYVAVTVVSDVDDKMVAAIKENGAQLPGVTIQQEYIREYEDSKYFSHIIGYMGTISESQLEQFKKDGHEEYTATDIVGKTGIESVMEYELAGTKGSQTLYVNSLGSILDTTNIKEAVPGNDIHLTIDAGLTKTVYDLLEEKIAGILLAKLSEGVDEDYNEALLISYGQVFHALIENNVIDIEHFYEEDATELEHSVGQRFDARLEIVLDEIQAQMLADIQAPQNTLTKEYDHYFTYIYSWLKEQEILLADRYDASEEQYLQWEQGKISLGDFLKYAIAQGWINTQMLEIDSEYADTSQVYEALVTALVNGIRDDLSFHKAVYKYMLAAGELTEPEVCLLLYDQGILDKASDTDYGLLVSGQQSAHMFIYQKIYKMEITPDMLALDICSGSCVITDVNTGEVRALVSYPSYDANRILETDYYSSLLNNESRPLFNRATQQTCAPGSTYKPLSALAGLQEGLVTLDTLVLDQHTFTKVFPNPSCWSSVSHGMVDVVSAIGQSCNYYFYDLGYNATLDANGKENDQQGLALLRTYAEKFGFGQTTGIEIGEAQPRISDESSVRSFIGQGTNNYTPTQVNRYISAVANKGTVYELSLIDKVTNSDGAVVSDNSSAVINTLSEIKPEYWDAVFKGMYQVCQNSYTYKDVFTSLDVSVAGKSGTAQESELKPDHAWFTGFAPYDAPEISVTVLISNGYGSTNVVDTFRDAVAAYFNLPLYKTVKSPDDETRHALFPINFGGSAEDMDDGAD